jgi:hypothetical protein
MYWCNITCRDYSAVSHGITWRHALRATRVEIEGATAFAISGLFLKEILSRIVIEFSWSSENNLLTFSLGN